MISRFHPLSVFLSADLHNVCFFDAFARQSFQASSVLVSAKFVPAV